MTEPGQRRPDIQEIQVTLMRAHITRGINLIKSGQGRQAYRHFLHLPDKNGLDVYVSEGKTFPVTQLLSEDDLVFVASTAAGHSHTSSAREATLGSPNLGRLGFSARFEDYPDLYNPDLVNRFHHEHSIIAAEEWLHMLQHATGASVAGQEDVEVDVAAYLDSQGVSLSADFLTRYPERAQWYITQHPEREEELREFDRKIPPLSRIKHSNIVT